MTAGLPVLLRLAVRRDRIMLPAWLYALVASVVSTAVSLRQLYPSQGSRDRLAVSINANPSLRALYGPLYDTHSLGALTAWRMLAIGPVMIALVSQLLITRHTRAEEESGRLELVAAGAVDRRAPLTAALITAGSTGFVFAGAVLALMLGLGQDTAGSLAFALVFPAVGLVFAGLTAVTAQLTQTGRAANGLAGATLGAAFLLRSIGDAAGSGGPGWVTWLSPLGWAERVRPYGGDHWWVLVLLFAAAAVEITAAYLLLARRDLGGGLLPQRPGPALAGAGLGGPLGLAWRLQRATLAAWAVGLIVFGFVLGGITKGLQQLINDTPSAAQIIERMGGTTGAVNSYLSTCMTFLAMAVAVYGVQTVLRLRDEETGGRAEPVLATAVGRLSWAGGHLLFPLLGTVVLLEAGGLAMGLGTGAVLGDTGGWIGRLLAAGLVQAPAVWLFGAAGTALYGLRPQWTAGVWGIVGVLLLITYLGPAVNASHWVLDLSPFTHVPRLPGGVLHSAPLLWLSLVSGLLAAAGLLGLRRRDLG
jgi:ABC-2 type transport system permease protein